MVTRDNFDNIPRVHVIKYVEHFVSLFRAPNYRNMFSMEHEFANIFGCLQSASIFSCSARFNLNPGFYSPV